MSVATGAVLALGAMAATSGAGGGGVTASAPAAGETAQQITQGQIAEAPAILQLAQQQDPQYQALQNQLTDQATQNLIQNYQQNAPQLQALQSGLNAQQAGANIGLVNQYAGQAVQAYQNANPQLQQLQNKLTGLATTTQNPVSQLSGAGSGLTNFAGQIGQQVGANSIQAPVSQSSAGMLSGFQPNVQNVNAASLGKNPTGSNYTNQMLQDTAQQQLALGTSISPQEASTVAYQVLSNYNQQGRANDPIAIAGLATGLDTYGQQLLQQREGAAATAATSQATQQGLGLQSATTQAGLNQNASLANQQAALTGSGLNLNALTSGAGLQQQSNLANQSANLTAQQTNLSSLLQSLGLQGSALQAGGAQQLQQGQYNQQAQLQNAQYQSGLLTTAANLAQQTALNPYALVLGQSGALGNAASTAAQGTGGSSANTLANQYNPFNTQLMSTLTNAGTQTSTTNAGTNSALLGGALTGASNYLGSTGGFGALLSGFCWVAREVYGKDSAKWRMVRFWMLRQSPRTLAHLYAGFGEGIAEKVRANPVLKSTFKQHFDHILMEATYA